MTTCGHTRTHTRIKYSKIQQNAIPDTESLCTNSPGCLRWVCASPSFTQIWSNAKKTEQSFRGVCPALWLLTANIPPLIVRYHFLFTNGAKGSSGISFCQTCDVKHALILHFPDHWWIIALPLLRQDEGTKQPVWRIRELNARKLKSAKLYDSPHPTLCD